MLNPSTADSYEDDATTRRVLAMAKGWGYGSYEAVNLFAFRSVSPKNLKTAEDPVGPQNDEAILRAVKRADFVVAAWGTHGTLLGRDKEVLALLSSEKLHCLHVTKHGHPGHPLYLKKGLKPTVYLGGG